MTKLNQILMVSAFLGLTTILNGCSRNDHSTHTHDSANPKPYPLQTCAVSGEKLGSMGDPVVFTHEGQEIKLCCKNCRPDFDKDPPKYLAKLAGSPK